jgi:hypothetical protein
LHVILTLTKHEHDCIEQKYRLDDQLRVKISDFGLCRDVYENGIYIRSTQTSIPMRWMPPNCEMEYTFKSDVVRVFLSGVEYNFTYTQFTVGIWCMYLGDNEWR